MQSIAFARHNGTHYDAMAAATANGRTWDFLTKYLQSRGLRMLGGGAYRLRGRKRGGLGPGSDA